MIRLAAMNRGNANSAIGPSIPFCTIRRAESGRATTPNAVNGSFRDWS